MLDWQGAGLPQGLPALLLGLLKARLELIAAQLSEVRPWQRVETNDDVRAAGGIALRPPLG